MCRLVVCQHGAHCQQMPCCELPGQMHNFMIVVTQERRIALLEHFEKQCCAMGHQDQKHCTGSAVKVVYYLLDVCNPALKPASSENLLGGQDPEKRPMITEVKDALLEFARLHFNSQSPAEAMALKHAKERALLDQILPPKVPLLQAADDRRRMQLTLLWQPSDNHTDIMLACTMQHPDGYACCYLTH